MAIAATSLRSKSASMITGIRSVGGSPVRIDGDVSADDEQATDTTAIAEISAASSHGVRREYPDMDPS
jgi:hypothetical protein